MMTEEERKARRREMDYARKRGLRQPGYYEHWREKNGERLHLQPPPMTEEERKERKIESTQARRTDPQKRELRLLRDRQRYAANPEKYREKARLANRIHRDRRLKAERAYNAKHPERVRERRRCYLSANRERISEHKRQYRAVNRERHVEYMRRWHEENKDHVEKYAARYRYENRERAREYAARRHAFRAAAVEFLRSSGIDVPGTDAARTAAMIYVRQAGLLPPPE